MIRFLTIEVILVMLSLTVISNDSTSTFINNGFLKDLRSRKQYISPITGRNSLIIKNLPLAYEDKLLVIYKIDTSLFIQIESSGRMYKVYAIDDSTYSYTKIDITVNYNYNQGSLNFIDQNDIYNFGGYGFWRNNGNLLKYNWKDKEWDITPLSKEIVSIGGTNGPAWFDSKEKKFYVPFESRVNGGINGIQNITGVISPYGWVLDLTKKEWVQTGKVSQEAFDIIAKNNTIIPADSGIIITSGFDLHFLNYKKNSVSKSIDKSIAQSIARIYNDKFAYYFNNHIYYFNSQVKKYDSLYVDLTLFIPEDFPIWENNSFLLNLLYSILGGTILVSLFLLYTRSKKRNKLKEKISNISETNFKLNFNDTEIALIKMLTSKFFSNKKATISEMNYVLGLKDKNIGLQKKVRSDVINSINSKYKYFLKKEVQLIQSIRSESDKRYFEYFIDSNEIRSIQKILKELEN